MWYDQPSIAWVIIATTVFGFLFYSLTVMACLKSPACPFQTPTSTMLRMLRIDRVLRLVFTLFPATHEVAAQRAETIAWHCQVRMYPIVCSI
ncbi:hypothetical protein BDR06DRAFT_121441 [Suillus hirtellus]|nr:hypothetical protein BDR06DRAFT_121441 [Suillus hirtellus]